MRQQTTAVSKRAGVIVDCSRSTTKAVGRPRTIAASETFARQGRVKSREVV
jgi:hypothetical protein